MSMSNRYESAAYKSGTWEKPEYMKNLTRFVLLMIVTLGIYFLYWVVKATEYTNLDETQPERSPGKKLALVMFIPFYELYWFYQTAKRLSNMGQKVHVAADNSVATVVLALFGLDIIGAILLQDSINKIEAVRSGANLSANGEGTCKHCGATFPNDAPSCPSCGAPYKRPVTKSVGFAIFTGIVGLLVLIGLFAGLLVFLEVQFPEEEWLSEYSEMTEEDYNDLFDWDTSEEETVAEEPEEEPSEAVSEEPEVSAPANGLVQQEDGSYRYFENGVAREDFRGIVSMDGDYWLVEGGVLSNTYSGTLDVDGETYTVDRGKILNYQPETE